MNYKNNSQESEVQRRLREIENELDRKYQITPVSSQKQGKKAVNPLTKLGRSGKAVVFGVVALTGIWALTTVVSFISMMLGFAIVGGVIYAAWKILYAR